MKKIYTTINTKRIDNSNHAIENKNRNLSQKTHIHFGLRIHIPIKFNELDTVGLIIELHLKKYKKINKKD